MAHIFNSNFIEFIQSLNRAKVEYLLVGGYAVILHGYNRTTGDMDIWVKPTTDNFNRLMVAFSQFGLPTMAISVEDFLDIENMDVFTFGVAPVSIDILTKVKGLHFEEAFAASSIYETQNTDIKLIHYNHLIEAKKAAGRYRDLNDIEHLEQE